jgi:hypothetical protein
MNIKPPNVNAYRMGVSSIARGSIVGAVDTVPEREIADTFSQIKQQEESLARELMTRDNSPSDLDDRVGFVEEKIDSKRLREHTILAYDSENQTPLELYKEGQNTSPSREITLDKAVRWTDGKIQFREHRYFKADREMKGTEAVVGDEFLGITEYQQVIVGYTFEAASE